MKKILLITILLFSVSVVHAEIKCYVSPDGDVLYSNKECPQGYTQAKEVIQLPVSTPVKKKTIKKSIKRNKVIWYYDTNNHLTILFNDNYSHGQEWGAFRKRMWGIYPDNTCGCLYNYGFMMPTVSPYMRRLINKNK